MLAQKCGRVTAACNHPIEGIKGRALKDSRRKNFLEVELENDGAV